MRFVQHEARPALSAQLTDLFVTAVHSSVSGSLHEVACAVATATIRSSSIFYRLEPMRGSGGRCDRRGGAQQQKQQRQRQRWWCHLQAQAGRRRRPGRGEGRVPSWGQRWQVTGTTAAAWIPRDVHRAPRSLHTPGSHRWQLRRLRAARAALPGVRATLPRRTHGPRGLQAAGRLGLDLCPQCRRCPRSPAVAARSPRGACLLRANAAWSPRGLSHSRRVQAAGARSCAAARNPGDPPQQLGHRLDRGRPY